jgi:hypothetical protein
VVIQCSAISVVSPYDDIAEISATDAAGSTIGNLITGQVITIDIHSFMSSQTTMLPEMLGQLAPYLELTYLLSSEIKVNDRIYE